MSGGLEMNGKLLLGWGSGVRGKAPEKILELCLQNARKPCFEYSNASYLS